MTTKIQPKPKAFGSVNATYSRRFPSPLVVLLCAVTIAVQLVELSLACQRVYFGELSQNNIACKCDANQCDSLEFEWPKDDDVYLRVLSDLSGARFELSELRSSAGAQDKLAKANANDDPDGSSSSGSHTQVADFLLDVQVNTRRQQVIGFGGAFTDSANQLIWGLPEQVRRRLIDSYFGPTGHDYSLGRVPISGTDMSTRPYSYDDLPDNNLVDGDENEEDLELVKFQLQPEDFNYKIPFIRHVNELRRKRQLEPLKLMAASWSAPAWMKSNDHLVQGRLKGNSSGPYYEAYARYLIKFLHEYERQNISMWALSPQNEPHTPQRVGPKKINFNSVNFEPHEMADLLENNLCPSLISAGKTPDKLNLFIWDDTLDNLDSYQRAAIEKPLVNEFTRGLAIHWYSQGLREKSYSHLFDARRLLPAKYWMMSTEASFIGRPRPGDWSRGVRYARDLIENLRAGSVGWIDWNLALNMSGGPTWSHNILDAAVLVDPEQEIFYKNPMYYALGHVARFAPPGSYAVASQLLARTQTSTNGTTTNGPNRAWSLASAGDEAIHDEVTAVVVELGEPLKAESGLQLKRRFSLIALNRAASERRLRVQLNECRAKADQPALILEMPASSVTSLAFLC